MLTRDDRKLLENVIEALNRIYDGDLAAVDACALVFATSKAFIGDELSPAFESAIRGLEVIVKSDQTPGQKRYSALLATDELTKAIAETVRRDAKENPKQRHVR